MAVAYVRLHTGDPGASNTTTSSYSASSVTWTSTGGGYLTSNPSWTNTTGSSITWNGPVGQYEEHECGIHDLKYKATRPGCPLCESQREIANLRSINKTLANEMTMKDEQLKQLQVNWDLLVAMRDAVDLVGEADLEFFKTVLYQWRDEKSLGLKFTYGYDDNKKKKSVNGFIVLPRKGDPWGYACTSIGGLAIASYFEEACAARGSMEAMAILTRALSDHLPGSLDEPGHTPA